MRLSQLIEATKAKPEPDGTYIAVRLTKETKDKIKKFIKDNDIPNPLDTSDLHSTMIYSRKYLPDYECLGKLDKPWKGKAKKFEVFDTEEGKKCLVVVYDCDKIEKRHKEIRKEHGATHDFPEYIPHVSLSYDIGKFDVDTLNIDDIGDIFIDEEFTEDLDLDK